MSSSYFLNSPLYKYEARIHHNNPSPLRQYFKQTDFRASMYRSRSNQENFVQKSLSRNTNSRWQEKQYSKQSYEYGNQSKLMEKIEKRLYDLKNPPIRSQSPQFKYLNNNRYESSTYVPLKPTSNYLSSSKSEPEYKLLTVDRTVQNARKVNLKQEIAKSLSKLSRVSKKIQEKPRPMFKEPLKKEQRMLKASKYSRVNKNYFQDVRNPKLKSQYYSNYGIFKRN